MGTSSSGGGASGSNPLIPSWISPVIPQSGSQGDGSGNQDGQSDSDPNNNPKTPDRQSLLPVAPPTGNRFRQPKSDFNTFVRSGGSDKGAFTKAVKGYSRSGGGGSQVLARRMQPSATRIVDFYNTINTIKQNGLNNALQQFSLSSYEDRPLLDTLSALSDIIFENKGKLFEDTQDESITKLAYANTVTRICENPNIDLNSLTNEQIEVMTAVFIEETIAQRVICDLGNKLPELESDVNNLLQIEENAYQIINGLVRTKIMPELIATQRGDKKDLDARIEDIYRIAFDALGGTENN